MNQAREANDTGSHTSIRGQLERQAQRNYPALAKRLDEYRLRRRPRPRHVRWQDRILLTLCAILVTLFVIRTEVSLAAESGGDWGLQLDDGKTGSVQLALATDVRADVTGLIARVTVTQRFTNPGDSWAEGVYRFPLPQGAAVDRMHVKIGKRVLEGEIQEKKTARRIYQRARDSGRSASLVEQQRRNQFETRLANIGPGETIEITIGYLENVSYSDAAYHLRIPMTFTPRWGADQPITHFTAQPSSAWVEEAPPRPALRTAADAGSHTLKVHANLLTSSDYASIESRYHDVDIRHDDGGYHIELLDPSALADRDFELRWTPVLETAPSASLTTFSDGHDVYAQLMLAPPVAGAIAAQPREVILVIDTSGSMAGTSLTQARAALETALDSLGSDDYFNILQFNSVTRDLFARPVPASHANLDTARDYLDGLRANGGTNMAPALKAALAAPETVGLMRQVVFITDGGVSNEAALLQQVAGQLGSSRLFTVAIGSAPNSWFMRKAAEIGRGSHVHIGKLSEVEAQISALWSRIRLPALTDICVDWGEDAEYYPEVIPDLYAGQPLWLVARLAGEPTTIGLCGRLNGHPWDLDVNALDINTQAGGPLAAGGGENLAILWARKKIESLEDGLMFGADPELTELQVTSLALDFGLLTKHTSLVAVDRTPRRFETEKIARTDVPSLLPAGSATRLAGYPQTATGWLSQLLLSLLVLLISSAMLWFSGTRLPMASHPAKSLNGTLPGPQRAPAGFAPSSARPVHHVG